MSSLFSTICLLALHLTVEMSIALCVGMKMMVETFRTSIDSLGSELASLFMGDFIDEETQHDRNGRPYHLTCSRMGNLPLDWTIIDRTHDAKRSIRSGFNPSLT